MTDTSRSFRMETALSDAIARRAAESGQSVTAYVIGVLERSLESPRPPEGASPQAGVDLEALRSEMRELGGLFRSERLIQAEIVDSLMALSKLARQLEREREATCKVVSEAVAGLKEAKVALKEMVDLGGVVDKKCRESSALMEKLKGSLDASASKIHAFLGAMETTARTSQQTLTNSQEELTKVVDGGVADMKKLWESSKGWVQVEARDYASKVFSETRGAFVFGAWALILITVFVLGFFAYQYVTAPKRPSYGRFEVPSQHVSIQHRSLASVPERARTFNPENNGRWS